MPRRAPDEPKRDRADQVGLERAMICRVCDSDDLEPVIDLGLQPWCNHFLRADEVGHEPCYPLVVVYCHACSTAQLDFTVPKETMFADHTYLSGVTRSLKEHFDGVAREVFERFPAGPERRSALDIGSNDGTQLKSFQELGFDVLGVESSTTAARIAEEGGVPTVHDFFNLELARRLGRRFSVINAAGVFFHLEELHSVTDGIREALEPDGVFVIQFLYMKRIIENRAFDQIYHEHLLYYNLETVQTLLSRHGLEIFDAHLAPIHGGSMIAFATHAGRRDPAARFVRLRNAEREERSNSIETYRAFSCEIDRMRDENLEYLDAARAKGKRVFGMGAPVKGNTLLNYFNVGSDRIECLVEKNELRCGLYSPGMHIPILIEKELPAPPDVYYVLAWNFKAEILANNQDLMQRGVEFYFPVDPMAV